MALTQLQRTVCRLLARNRVASGKSYVAGGVAPRELLATNRISRDAGRFHDAAEEVAQLSLGDAPPGAAALSRDGHRMLAAARVAPPDYPLR